MSLIKKLKVTSRRLSNGDFRIVYDKHITTSKDTLGRDELTFHFAKTQIHLSYFVQKVSFIYPILMVSRGKYKKKDIEVDNEVNDLKIVTLSKDIILN